MRFIPTRVHGLLDYGIGLLVLASPWLFGFSGNGAVGLHVIAGLAILLVAAMTDFELGIVRVIPMPVHLMLDAGIGLFALASPWLFGFQSYAGLHVVLGAAEIGAALMTSTHPGTPVVRA